VGLLGILLDQQIISVGRQMIAGTSLRVAWQQLRCTQHLIGATPGRHAEPPEATLVTEGR
jgi:xanthosine utilization system XapX-like protein